MAQINKKLGIKISSLTAALALASCAAIGGPPAGAQTVSTPGALPAAIPSEMASYADLVALSDNSELVIRAEIRRQIKVDPERAQGVKPGYARLYIEARTLGLIAGNRGVGESLAYVVDVALDAKGKVPKLKKSEVLIFANRVTGRPGVVQLTGDAAQFAYSPELEARLRPILTGLVSNNAPPVVTGIADALAVKGTLVGESETQVFLKTVSGSPVSFTVVRRPNEVPRWGVSWGEIIDSSATAPAPRTLEWYRLACALPGRLPSSANLARDPETRNLAEQDYRLVIESLGPCERRVTGKT